MAPRGDLTTVGLRISGRVQGVWYRGWAVEKATELGLSGWVRNVTNGTVEILINGPKDKVDGMIASCKSGPPSAQVDSVDITVVDQPGKGGAFPTTGFDQLGTFDPSDLPNMT
jgi:acylphosphatase